MRSQSNFEKKSQLSSSQLDIDNSVKNTQKSIKKYPSQQELFYYVEKQIGNNKDITLKGARQSFSQSGVELSTQQSRQKRQKIIYLQRDMIQYAPENMLLKQTSQLLKNKLKKPSNLYEMKDFDQEQFQHFKRDVHMPFANIFPNSNQKLSKLLGYEPTNQSLIGMNEFRLAMEKRSIKALVNKQQAGNTTNGSRLQPVLLKDPMKNFDTFFTTKLEYHKKEQILSPQKKKQYKEDDVPLRRSDIFQQEIVQSKHKIYRNIIIVHINPFRQNAVELLEYRIPFYVKKITQKYLISSIIYFRSHPNIQVTKIKFKLLLFQLDYSNTEQVLKDNFSSNQRLMDNLFENATKYFQLPYQLKFVSLLDETPINQLQDIPLDQNIIIISNNPKDNFWLKFYDSKQMAKPNEKEFQSLLNKLNNINDVHQIDLFFKNKKSFLTGIDDFSAHTSCILNSNNLSKFNSTQNLQQVKNPKEIITELQPCNNDLRTSKYENQFRQTLSQSTNNPTPNKLNSQIFQANISISSPNNYQITRGSFLSPYSKKQSQLSYSRLESFATPQKSHSGMFSSILDLKQSKTKIFFKQKELSHKLTMKTINT